MSARAAAAAHERDAVPTLGELLLDGVGERAAPGLREAETGEAGPEGERAAERAGAPPGQGAQAVDAERRDDAADVGHGRARAQGRVARDLQP